MNLPTSLLLLATILSSVAIGLPLWSVGPYGSKSGLWSACRNTNITINSSSNRNILGKECVTYDEFPFDIETDKSVQVLVPRNEIIISQILSITGVVFVFLSLILCIINNKKWSTKKWSTLFAFISLLCMIATLIAYPVLSNHLDCPKGDCNNLGISYGLQAGATALTLLGFIILIKRK